MKRFARLICLAVALTLALGAVCAAEEPLILSRPADADQALAWAREQTWDKTYTVGFANICEDVQSIIVLGDYLEECFEAYGMKVIRVDNNYDGMTAVKNVQALLAQKIDALVEFNVDESVGGAIMELCNAAGIPVMAIDIPHEGATFFGANNALAGTLAGKAVGEAAMKKWDCAPDVLLLIDQMASGDLPRQRVLKAEDGLREVFPDFDSEKVFLVEGGTSFDAAQIAANAFLSAHPNEKIGIVCLSSTSGLGVQSAIEVAGRVADCVMVVNNEDYFFSDVKNHPDESAFCAAITFQLTQYGKWIAPAMREIIDTGVKPENVYVEHSILTRENIDALFPTWQEDMANGIYAS